MKFGFKDLWIDIDTKDAYKYLNEQLDLLCDWGKDHFVKKEIKIAFIDDRYQLTGYIISYGILYLTKHQLQTILKHHRYWQIGCEDFLTQEEYQYVLYDSHELSGYELDTPELCEFDIIIKDT